MSIGEGEPFEKGVVYMPQGQMKNVAGLVLTAFTRFKEGNDFTIGTKHQEITTEEILKNWAN